MLSDLPEGIACPLSPTCSELRCGALMQNWQAAQAEGRLEYIAGLEDNDD
jgi:hypothetical protein